MINRFRAMTWRQRAAWTAIGIALYAAFWAANKGFAALALWRSNTSTEAAQYGVTLGFAAALVLVPIVARWAQTAYERLGGRGRTQTTPASE